MPIPKNINDTLKIIDEIEKLKKCKDGNDWDKIVPNEKIRSVIFYAYLNKYQLAFFDNSFMLRHDFLLDNKKNNYKWNCDGCWDCCASLIDINYREFYTNNFKEKNKIKSEAKKNNREEKKETLGDERYKTIMALEKKITRYKKENKDISDLLTKMKDLKDINKPFMQEKITDEEKKEIKREQTRLRQKKYREKNKDK
jgi:hypothetical protein